MSPPPAEQFAARIFMGPALRAQPDRRLVDLVRDGYDAAFEEIVRRYRRPLDRFAAAIVGGRSEDVTQDAFSKALLALRGTEAEIELRPWLYRIVRNTALNDLRDRAPETAELNDALPGSRSAAAEAEAREELTELMERLGALPEPQRAALVMRELEGLSHEEIAAALGVSGGAARQAIYRARAALREGLGLLLPMPLVRTLADHGDAATGGAVAAGASTAGGAALGGLGGGAVKAGVATLLVAGAVGAGVAVDHRQGERAGPEQAEAAPLVERPGTSAGPAAGGGSSPRGSAEGSSGHGRGEDRGDDSDRGEGGDDLGGDLSGGDRSGSSHGSDRSGHSGHSGSGSRGGQSENSGSGSVSSGRHSGDDDDGEDDHSGPGSGEIDDDSSGSGSGSSGSGDDGDSSGSGSEGSGSGESGSSGGSEGGDSSGPGSGEVEPEPEEPVVEEEPDDDSSGSGSEGSGSGELGGLG
ncbi:MAG TPA: RNA polymerase sigma factor [Solirubrobacterales bacterium]